MHLVPTVAPSISCSRGDRPKTYPQPRQLRFSLSDAQSPCAPRADNTRLVSPLVVPARLASVKLHPPRTFDAWVFQQSCGHANFPVNSHWLNKPCQRAIVLVAGCAMSPKTVSSTSIADQSQERQLWVSRVQLVERIKTAWAKVMRPKATRRVCGHL